MNRITIMIEADYGEPEAPKMFRHTIEREFPGFDFTLEEVLEAMETALRAHSFHVPDGSLQVVRDEEE